LEPGRLFVYGTLRRGSPNKFAQLLEASARFMGIGRIQARIYRFPNYPGAVASDDLADSVSGELFELTDPSILAVLDAYEGAEFERATVSVRLDTGDPLQAWVYFLKAPPGE